MADDENVVVLRPGQDMKDDERMLAMVPFSEQSSHCGHMRNAYSLDPRTERAYCRECKEEVPLFQVLESLARETERYISQRKETRRRANVATGDLETVLRLERNAKARARKALAKLEVCACHNTWSGWGSAYWRFCPVCGGTRPEVSAEQREADRGKTLERLQTAGVADMLDEVTKRLASRMDKSDTDEGMERVQTWLNERITDALVSAVLAR